METNPAQLRIDTLIAGLRLAMIDYRIQQVHAAEIKAQAMNAWAAATRWEAEQIDLDDLWIDIQPELFVMPVAIEHCESCGGDLRYGEHEVRVDVDEWRCFEGGHMCGFRVR